MTAGKLSAFLLALLILTNVMQNASASRTDKEEAYKAALLELETYPEGSGDSSGYLESIAAAFDELGGYVYSRPLRYYTMALLYVSRNEFDDRVKMILDILELSLDFQAYLEEGRKSGKSSIGTVSQLKAYVLGRQAEWEGNIGKAREQYQNCLEFFDTQERYVSLNSIIAKEQKRQVNHNGILGFDYPTVSEIIGECSKWMQAFNLQGLETIPNTLDEAPVFFSVETIQSIGECLMSGKTKNDHIDLTKHFRGSDWSMDYSHHITNNSADQPEGITGSINDILRITEAFPKSEFDQFIGFYQEQGPYVFTIDFHFSDGKLDYSSADVTYRIGGQLKWW